MKFSYQVSLIILSTVALGYAEEQTPLICQFFPHLCTSSVTPSGLPSNQPSTSQSPTIDPTRGPSLSPTGSPSNSKSSSPTSTSSTIPTTAHTSSPSQSQSTEPTSQSSFAPSLSNFPTSSSSPTQAPSHLPSGAPTFSSQPSSLPSGEPTIPPTMHPTEKPTETMSPTIKRSVQKSEFPSYSSSSPSESQTPTIATSTEPTVSSQPSFEPTDGPSYLPSDSPSGSPTWGDRPNLIMILTDEHNLRTLGCYREYFRSKQNNDEHNEQAHVWGEGVEVETPNIDRLAAEGALFTNFVTVAPLCTPSRASFMSGLYPHKTGNSTDNHGRMEDDIVTFAEVLETQRDYYTGYFGKWHLNGHEKPGFGNDERKFGFTETKYQWNRGHWKYIDEVDGNLEAYEIRDKNKFKDREETHFTTDYLFDRGIEFMETAKSKNQPFAYVLSIPDPHAPNEVRSPYNVMYKDVHFNLPKTAKSAVMKDPAAPGWNYNDHSDVPLDGADEYLSSYENGSFYQNHLQQYWGMVKCIDDNVGKLLKYLNSTGIDEETIIVFTADHGDLLGEHGKLNKGRPFRTSAGVPFIVRYPGQVDPGKIVNSALSSVDFAPTILNLMGANNHGVQFDGSDFSGELTSKSAVSNYPRVRFTFDSTYKGEWAAVMSRSIKIVVSKSTEPWLFDTDSDPFEINNYFDDPKYSSIRDALMDRLFPAITAHGMSIADVTNVFYWSTPACRDSNNRIEIDSNFFTCSDVGKKKLPFEKCSEESLKNHCPTKCQSCCEDSQGKLWFQGELRGCDQLKFKCGRGKIKAFCPVTCGICANPNTIFSEP